MAGRECNMKYQDWNSLDCQLSFSAVGGNSSHVHTFFSSFPCSKIPFLRQVMIFPSAGLMKILLKGLLPAVKSSLDHVAAENVARLLTVRSANAMLLCLSVFICLTSLLICT